MIRFVRHCESVFNACSDSKERDCGLTELGREQAKSLQGSFDLVICSPMRRCRETLALSKITYSLLLISDLCREHRTDPCDFLPDEDVSQIESESEVLDRVRRFRSFLASVEGRSICVVTHADFYFYFSGQKRGDEWFGRWLENGEWA